MFALIDPLKFTTWFMISDPPSLTKQNSSFLVFVLFDVFILGIEEDRLYTV